MAIPASRSASAEQTGDRAVEDRAKGNTSIPILQVRIIRDFQVPRGPNAPPCISFAEIHVATIGKNDQISRIRGVTAAAVIYCTRNR